MACYLFRRNTEIHMKDIDTGLVANLNLLTKLFRSVEATAV